MKPNRAEVSCKQLADAVKRRDCPNQAADGWITAKVQAEIFNEPSLKAAQINVATCKHMVQLSGFVDGTASMNKAVAIARSVKGVIAVNNHMRFR